MVVTGDGPSLLGRDWLRELQLDWGAIHQVVAHNCLQAVLRENDEIFKDELGLVRGVQAKIYVDPQARPCFCKPRAVPYSLRKKVDSELEQLEEEGIIEQVKHSA